MRTANIGTRVVVGFQLDIDRIERENGVVTVAGRVELEGGKKIWVNVPLEWCAEFNGVNEGVDHVN